MKVKRRLARLNHILIPSSAEARARLRRSIVGRIARRFEGLYYRATVEGQLVAAVALLAAITGLDVQGTDAHQLFSIAVALLLGSFVVSQRLGLDGVRARVRCAPRVTVGEPMRFSIELENEREVAVRDVRVNGPFLPWDGAWSGEAPRVTMIAPRSAVQLECRAVFLQRGEHHLEGFHVASAAPLGLALGPPLRTGSTRFVVVPRVAPVRSLRMPQPRATRAGAVAQRAHPGTSMDLLGTRPYRPGDRARDLDVRSWARTGSPVVREYAQESLSAVGVLLDPSGDDGDAFDARLSLAAGMLAFLTGSGAIAELLVASDEGRELSIGSRFASLEHALELLACVDPRSAQSPEALVARVARREAPWSRALLVCGSLGPWQRAVRAALSSAGVPCGIYVIDERGDERISPSSDERTLSAARVLSGEGLWL